MRPATKPPACAGCPAAEWGVGFVPPTGPEGATVLLLGQGAGEQEALHSKPFVSVAPSGARLDSRIHKAGGQRTDLLVANVVYCWLPERYTNGTPFGNRLPTEAEKDACWQRHLGPWLTGLPNVRWIVPIGDPAAKAMLGLPWDESAQRWMGAVVERELPPLEAPK